MNQPGPRRLGAMAHAVTADAYGPAPGEQTDHRRLSRAALTASDQHGSRLGIEGAGGYGRAVAFALRDSGIAAGGRRRVAPARGGPSPRGAGVAGFHRPGWG